MVIALLVWAGLLLAVVKLPLTWFSTSVEFAVVMAMLVMALVSQSLLIMFRWSTWRSLARARALRTPLGQLEADGVLDVNRPTAMPASLLKQKPSARFPF